MAEALEKLHDFDVAGSTVTVWTFKRSVKDKAPVFTGRWVTTDDDLDAALRAAVDEARGAITETLDYALLAQNNESSALTLGTDETYAGHVIVQASDPTPAKKIKRLKELTNTDFYVVKLVTDDGKVLYAARKTDGSWTTKNARGVVTAVFSDEGLSLEHGVRFSLSKYFDFLFDDETIFVTNKGHFESLLSYKAAHVADFTELQGEPDFQAIFSELELLAAYVGTNKIQLRRASAIRQKGHYKNPDFMQRLRNECGALELNISFDQHGRIVPTLDSCRDIFQALLDHRLDSRMSKTIYDVEATAPISNG